MCVFNTRTGNTLQDLVKYHSKLIISSDTTFLIKKRGEINSKGTKFRSGCFECYGDMTPYYMSFRIGGQQYFAGSLRRRMTSISRKAFFLPGVLFSSSCEIEDRGRVPVLSVDCSVSSVGNCKVLASWCDGGSVRISSVKTRYCLLQC